MGQEFESEKVATDVEEKLDSSIFGLSALKILIDAIEDKLDNNTWGLSALKILIDAIEDKLDNNTWGLSALKILIDAIETKLDDGTTGLAALKALIDDIETKLDLTEILLKFPSAESFNDIAAIGPTNTTAMPIVVVLPVGATIRRSMLAAFITVMNDTANLQKIDVDVQGRLPLAAWNTYFSQNDCIGVPNVDAATTGFVPVQDVSALVNVAGTYEFRCAVTQTAANSVHYTINYVLIITYRMS